MNIYAKILSNDWLNEAMLKRLKAELRSESWQKHARAEKSGKLHFSAPIIFLPSFRQASHRVAVSRSDLEIGGHGWPAQFDPVRPKNKSESVGRIRKIARLPEPVQAVVKSRQVCRAILSRQSPGKVEAAAAMGGLATPQPLLRRRVKPRSGLDRVSPHRQFMRKYFGMNNLQQRRCLAGSRSVKLDQTDLASISPIPPMASIQKVFAGSSL
jgi:hypothetical protein